MIRLQKPIIFAVSFLVIPVLLQPLHAAGVLDIGTDYRLRGISYTNVDYGATPDQKYQYYSQRLLAHIGGRFSPNIELMTQFQAIGVAGSSTSITSPVVDQTGGRYPTTNLTPWVQHAYVKVKRLYDKPIDITLGRQPIMVGDGFLLSDDDLGFTGIRLETSLPWWGLQADLFTFKVKESLSGKNDADAHGVQLIKPTRNVRYSLFLLVDRDASGTTYVRPVENAAAITAPLAASRITRTYYDARIEGRLLQGGFYKGELALQNGRVQRDPALGSVDLGGYGFLFSAGLYTKTSKYGPIEVHGTFGQASGDDGTASKDTSFHPPHGHRFDGLERSGFGEYYGATLYDALGSGTFSNGLPPGHSGLRVIGGGVTAHPTALFSFGIDYFVYDSQETASAAFPTTPTESGLGSELDFGMGFAYTNYLNFRASAAFFSPGEAYNNRSKARRFLVEAVAKF